MEGILERKNQKMHCFLFNDLLLTVKQEIQNNMASSMMGYSNLLSYEPIYKIDEIIPLVDIISIRALHEDEQSKTDKRKSIKSNENGNEEHGFYEIGGIGFKLEHNKKCGKNEVLKLESTYLVPEERGREEAKKWVEAVSKEMKKLEGTFKKNVSIKGELELGNDFEMIYNHKESDKSTNCKKTEC